MSPASSQSVGRDRGAQLAIVDEGLDQLGQIFAFDHRRDQCGFNPVANDFQKTTASPT